MTDTASTGFDRKGFWLMFATIAAASMAFIDQTALNVTMPALQTDPDASGVDLLWFINIYQLLLGALNLGGSLGDLYGRKRIYTYGIVIFAFGSLACGLASSIPVLIVSRGVQGLGVL